MLENFNLKASSPSHSIIFHMGRCIRLCISVASYSLTATVELQGVNLNLICNEPRTVAALIYLISWLAEKIRPTFCLLFVLSCSKTEWLFYRLVCICSNFAPCKRIHEGPGFRILASRFRIHTKVDSGFRLQKFAGFRILLHGATNSCLCPRYRCVHCSRNRSSVCCFTTQYLLSYSYRKLNQVKQFFCCSVRLACCSSVVLLHGILYTHWNFVRRSSEVGVKG